MQTQPLALNAFKDWFKRSKKGDRITYHRGWHLGGVEDLARVAWFMYENGYVHLFQRRTAEGFEYLVERK